jgi:hypothetical protein
MSFMDWSNRLARHLRNTSGGLENTGMTKLKTGSFFINSSFYLQTVPVERIKDDLRVPVETQIVPTPPFAVQSVQYTNSPLAVDVEIRI